jgi:hypothetical protein
VSQRRQVATLLVQLSDAIHECPLDLPRSAQGFRDGLSDCELVRPRKLGAVLESKKLGLVTIGGE